MRPGRLVLTLTTIIRDTLIRRFAAAEQVWTSRVIPKLRATAEPWSLVSLGTSKSGVAIRDNVSAHAGRIRLRGFFGAVCPTSPNSRTAEGPQGSRPILGCAAFPLRTLAHSSLRAAGHPRARKPRYRHHELRVERFPRPFSENDTGFEIPQMRVVDSTPSDRILRLQN